MNTKDNIKEILAAMRRRNVTDPTPERPTWLVRFDYVLSLDGIGSTEVEIEAEWEDDEDMSLLSIRHGEREVSCCELLQSQFEDIYSEAAATAKAYGIFEAIYYSRAERDLTYVAEHGLNDEIRKA